jgi:hypothetical protein
VALAAAVGIGCLAIGTCAGSHRLQCFALVSAMYAAGAVAGHRAWDRWGESGNRVPVGAATLVLIAAVATVAARLTPSGRIGDVTAALAIGSFLGIATAT